VAHLADSYQITSRLLHYIYNITMQAHDSSLGRAFPSLPLLRSFNNLTTPINVGEEDEVAA
jgi:hypothetical protein